MLAAGRQGQRVRETDLYPPIKAFLESQGYEVKAEIGPADVVACRAGEDPVIVELKTGFSLALLHQAVARQAVTDAVYMAVPHSPGRAGQAALKNMVKLARRLALGLITVRLDDGLVAVHCDPGAFQPRKMKARQAKLLREFARRAGDPNEGGRAARAGLITAYRQDALRCAAALSDGPLPGREVAKAAGVGTATRIMADNHYGWFERVARGVYALTETGRKALSGGGKTG